MNFNTTRLAIDNETTGLSVLPTPKIEKIGKLDRMTNCFKTDEGRLIDAHDGENYGGDDKYLRVSRL